MLVKLQRASGPQPGRREWQKADLGFGRAVLFGCPFCSAVGIIGPPPATTADGMVIATVSCSSGKCDFAFQVFLEGWADLNRVVPFAAGGFVEKRPEGVLCRVVGGGVPEEIVPGPKAGLGFKGGV